MSTYAPLEDNEGKADPSQWIARSLRYLSHGRLMLICLALGISAGLVYFVFGRPLYASRSILKVTVLALPVHNDSGRNDSPMNSVGRMWALRACREQLLSGQMQSRVAQKLGIAGPKDSPEFIRQFSIPYLEITFVDNDFLEVNVSSYFPHVVRDYAQTLVAEFTSFEKETSGAFRERALNTYVQELEQYRGKLDEQLKKRMDFEESTSLAQVFIQQNSLTQVPKEIVLTKAHLQSMEAVRDRMARQGADLDVVTKLSLLSSAHADAQVNVEVGSVVRNNASGTIQTVQPQSKAGEIIVSPPMVENIEPWRDLEKRQRELQEELRRTAAKYQPGHEAMRKVTGEMAAVQDKLKAELDVAVQRFELELAQLRNKLSTLEAKLPEYNEVTAKYEKFRQDYQLLEKGQLDWDKAHSELALNIAKLQFGADKDRVLLDFGSTLSMRDVDPVAPSKQRLMMIAVGLGLMLAFGLPTVLMFWDTSVNRLQDIEERTGVRGIGLIPLAAQEFLEDIFRAPTLDAKVPNFLLEAHRIIRSNITLHPNKHHKSQVVMVTSARPTEGKTTLASNLAWAFHSMGDKVLLVDCDLRRGRVAKITKLTNDSGLGQMLKNTTAAGEGVVKTELEGLDVIPRGPIITGVTELLCTETFEEMVKQWRLTYDRIVLDTPPVLGLSETSSIQRVADGVVMVVRAHRTLTKDVADAVDILRRTGAHLFGIVLNAVDLSKLANHYTYYYYSPLYYAEMEDKV